MEYVETIRKVFGVPIDYPQVSLAILVFIVLIIADHYHKHD